MTRRLRPPAHPVTGNPPVDNELRNAWRKGRDFMRSKPTSILIALTPPNIWWIADNGKLARGPRKRRKRLVQATTSHLFRYHPADYYTPERTIL